MGPTEVAQVALDASAMQKKHYTKEEAGKLNRKFFTREWGKVKACGHKFHPTDEPHTKCVHCWEAYFMAQEGIRIGVDSIVRSFGMKKLVDVKGERFVKMYNRFINDHPIMARGDVVRA